MIGSKFNLLTRRAGYSQYFTNQFHRRSCIKVSRLPKDAQIEIKAIAYCNVKGNIIL